MSSSRRPPAMREQLRLLRYPCDHESMFQMLQRFLFEGATGSLYQINHRNCSLLGFFGVFYVNAVSGCRISPSSACVDIAGGGSRCDELRIHGLCTESGGGAADPVCDVSQTGRVDRVQVQVRRHVLRDPQVPGETRLFFRFQEGGTGGNSACKSRHQS